MPWERVGYLELEHRANVQVSTFKAWRTQGNIGWATITAALGALGWSLVPVRRVDCLPAPVRKALNEIGQHFRSDEEAFGAAILAAATLPALAVNELERMREIREAKAA